MSLINLNVKILLIALNIYGLRRIYPLELISKHGERSLKIFGALTQRATLNVPSIMEYIKMGFAILMRCSDICA